MNAPDESSESSWPVLAARVGALLPLTRLTDHAGSDALRRALRDSDPRVVESAAQAIEPFRSTPHRTVVQAARPPRNVSRMR